MECRDVRAIGDAYLDDELLIETNHALLSHLQHCDDCRAELAARRAFRAALKAAVDRDERLAARAGFTTGLRHSLQAAETQFATPVWRRWVPWIAAAAAMAWLFASAWGLSRSRPAPTVAEDPTMISLVESAIGNHRDCALRHQPSEPPISLEAAAAYDTGLRRLDEAVRAPAGSLPAALNSMAAHACIWRGRRFGHVVLSYKGVITSVLVTIPGRDLTPFELKQPENCPAPTSGFAVACFAAPRHAVFVVSDLPSTETVALAQVLAPGLRHHFTRVVAWQTMLDGRSTP